MLKGCKKNVVYVKNTGSEIFEEAYFIVSDSKEAKGRADSDIVSEAGRIISCSPIASYFTEGKKEAKSKKSSGRLLFFVLGATVMAVLNAIIYLII